MLKTKLSLRVMALVLALMLVAGCTPSSTTTEQPETTTDITETEVPVVEEVTEEEVKPAKDFNQDRSATGSNGGVASGKSWSSEIGTGILKQGGNAVDAAVATAFAVGAFEPNASGIGGGGLMLIHMADGTETFIDFREMAPASATEDMYPLDADGEVIDKLNSRGGKAVGVPGEVAGLLHALEKYGTMTPQQVMQPTIDACRAGIPVTEALASAISNKYEDFLKWESAPAVYFDPATDLPYEEGDVIVNEGLAKTLEIIAEQGRDGFYKGDVAKAIVDEVNRTGGAMTLADLEAYEAKERAVIKGTYRGYDILTVTPPSSGGAAIIELLNIMENVDLPSMEYDSPETLHYWAEAMKMVFADRAKFMGDPDYVDVPTNGLISKEYAKILFDKIDTEAPATGVVEDDPWKFETGNTTHLSTMDSMGNVVSVTRTVNDYFGSCVLVPETGIVLNNEMLDFDAEPGRANSVHAGKRPLSSMTPTIVLKDGTPYVSIGSPGGMRIITHVATTISKIIDHNLPLQEAINSPRIYSTHESDLWVEENRFPDETVKKLEEMGHKLNLIDWSGSVTAVENKDGVFTAAGDSRIDGQGAAY